MKKDTQNKSIKVGQIGKKFLIKVIGAGDLENSHLLKNFIHQMIEKGYGDYIICLEHCPYMNSTFIGALIGITLLLKERYNKTLILTGINKTNRDLLETLGVLHSFKATGKKINLVAEMRSLKKSQISQLNLAKHTLKAHEDLISVSKTSKIKFKTVTDFLKKEIAELEG